VVNSKQKLLGIQIKFKYQISKFKSSSKPKVQNLVIESLKIESLFEN